MFERLGIAEEMKARTKVQGSPAQIPQAVAKGEAEIGVGQASEIVPVSGAQLVGPLPGELGSVTKFTAGIGAGSNASEAGKSLVQFLRGPDAAPVFKSKGLQPG